VLDRLDQIVADAPLAPLQTLVEGLERLHEIAIVRPPQPCLTMLRAEDSLDQQEFLLGEALTTSCEVSINTVPGYGLCLGEEPVRAYCSAVLDSLREQNLIDPVSIAALQSMHDKLIEDQRAEYAQILRTQVDFKLLEQE